jgi:ATPase
MEIEKLVPDTSVIIEGLVSTRIAEKKFNISQLLIHEAVVAELEHQSNKNRTIGFLGLDEINKLKGLSEKNGFEIIFKGRRPTQHEIKYSSLGEIDALIRELAFEEGATLFTADNVQAKVAEIRGVAVIFEEITAKKKTLDFEKYFDATTMSVHLRENVEPFAKRGVPGNWEFIKLRKKLLDRQEVQEMAKEIVDESTVRIDGFVEIERKGSTIVQLGSYRIVITRPPLSDGWEITAVKPIRIMRLDEYAITEKLQKRLSEQAEGILIAGAPGMGKSTFAQALAIYYAEKGKIVKTVEAPRDLTLPETITQYSISHGTSQEIHDILLLSRPDYTVFDEMRNTPDFKLFADLRLAGIGLAGVVHATRAIDAIQRFVGRIELGVIPQIIDTVIFIKNGEVSKVLNLEMTVKVPAGMFEADLARPVVVIRDFESGKTEFELYTYGEETVVIPVFDKKDLSPTSKLASKAVKEAINKYSRQAKVEMLSDNRCTVYAPPRDIPRLIGRSGSNIDRLEKMLGVRIDVQELAGGQDSGIPKLRSLNFDFEADKKKLMFSLGGKHRNRDLDIHIGENFLFSAKVGKDGKIKLSRDSDLADAIMDALDSGEEIKLVEK